MSSKFAPRTTRRNTPPWCYPGMFPRALAEHDGKPTSIVVSATSFTDVPVQHQRITESFTLWRDESLPGWRGQSAPSGTYLLVRVKETASPNVYDLDLLTFVADLEVEDAHWLAQYVPPFPNFDSGTLRKTWAARPELQEIHLRA